jgi:hypothetical protein
MKEMCVVKSANSFPAGSVRGASRTAQPSTDSKHNPKSINSGQHANASDAGTDAGGAGKAWQSALIHGAEPDFAAASPHLAGDLAAVSAAEAPASTRAKNEDFAHVKASESRTARAAAALAQG